MQMEESQSSIHSVKIDTSGRIILPAHIRERMGVTHGDTVLVVEDDEVVRIETAAKALEEAREYFADLVARDVSLVDELIADRRDESARE